MANEAKPGSIHARLLEAVSEARGLNDQLETVIGEPISHQNTAVKRGKIAAAPIPWYSQAAYLLLDLHAWSREREALMRMAAQLPARDRGGSSSNTGLALESNISVAWNTDHGRVEECCSWLEQWARKARIALGEVDRPRLLPQFPGQSQPKCPFCQHTTLRFWPLRGEVRCIDSSCTDPDGKRPRAVMEISSFTHNWELIWQDGGVGVP